VASIASANLDGDDILPAVASALDLPYEGRGKEALLQDVKRHLISLHAHQAHALLVVDEAQTLTPAALEMLRILSNFEFKGRALLQIFLVGQTELRRVMVSNHMEQLRQRIIASHRLEPMSEEESRAYILHRLHTVGWSNDPDLAPEIFTGVYRASRGIPRKINLIMDRLLLHGYLEELHNLDQAALTVVLDEIHDEMPGVPPTLEVPAMPQDLDLTRAAVSSQRDGGIAAMDLERSKFMLQLLREEVRRREVLLAASSMAPVMDEAVIADARYPRSSQEGK
ncbi:MAG: ATPase, partial [Rhodanobacter sp. RIFOXYA1_FULL_67_6]